MNFVVLWLYVKVFFAKFGAWCPLALQKRAIREVFSAKIVFSPIHESFSLESFPLYGSVLQAMKSVSGPGNEAS